MAHRWRLEDTRRHIPSILPMIMQVLPYSFFLCTHLVLHGATQARMSTGIMSPRSYLYGIASGSIYTRMNRTTQAIRNFRLCFDLELFLQRPPLSRYPRSIFTVALRGICTISTVAVTCICTHWRTHSRHPPAQLTIPHIYTVPSA